MTAGRPHVLVVVVTHDSAGVVGDCLRSLPAAFAGAATFDVVVVDSGSADDTDAVVRRAMPEAQLVRLDANLGYAAGINRGVAHPAERDAVLVLNPDVRPSVGSIAPMLAELAQEGVGVVVPRLTDLAGATSRSLRREPTLLRQLGEAVLGERAGRWPSLGEVVQDPAEYEEAHTVDWATGAALLIDQGCLDVVGFWDESYFLYSEETDFLLRARDVGLAVRYVPDASFVHLGGESNTSSALWAVLVRNRVRLYRLRHGLVAGEAFALVTLLGEVVRALVGRDVHRAGVRALRGREPGAMPVHHTDGVVCFSAQDYWYFSRGHSDLQLMASVARRRPVLLVNSLGMRMPMPGRSTAPLQRIARKVRSVARGLRRPEPDRPSFHVMSPLALPAYGDGAIARANRRVVAAQVRLAMRRAGISRPIVVVTLPTAWPVVERLGWHTLVAYRSDRYSALPEADSERVAVLERELLAAADVSCFSSGKLLADEEALTRRPVLLRHGVDGARFRPLEQLGCHPQLASISRPRIGYVGMIDAYTVDLDLLASCARSLPEVQLVLVGPVEVALGALLQLDNVHHVGVLPFDEVPSFCAGLDVALMPWQRNEWIEGCNPVKLKEYLAVGVPVVSTDFPEVRRYADVISVARDAEAFVAAVRQALGGGGVGTPEARRAAALAETWDVQADVLLESCIAATSRDRSELACAAS